MDNPSAAEIAWAAGIFEGEGCVSLARVKGRAYLRLIVHMSDQDVIRRLQSVLGGYVKGPWPRPNEMHKPMWQWAVYSKADAQRIATLLWPWLGGRRKSKFRECFLAAGVSVEQYT